MESQVSELNDLLLNIYSNYIPNTTVLCDDNDPPLITNGTRTTIEMKNNAYKEYIMSDMRHNYYVRPENLTTGLSNLIRDTKTEYHSKLAAKSVIPSDSDKIYWSILKTFTNGRKVPVVPPLLINKLIISAGSLTKNVLQFPWIAHTSFNLATNEAVTTVNFDEQLISKLIVALNPNKVHGHDELSICMLQMGSISLNPSQ